jgi:hypothetical protein
VDSVPYPQVLGKKHHEKACRKKQEQDKLSGKSPVGKSGDKVLRMNKALAAVFKNDEDSE